ncbi:putative RNA-directed DNA polymerase [Helianthus annuus]|nr:putative RNA-directed DNA polymerase [Helianthus annuus]
MMENMDFPLKWISWIKGCLVSGRGSVLVNGSPSKEFRFKRGLRQGDPLSPFLFIIAMEVITLFINRACASGLYHGCKLPNGGPNITHLGYADDVVFVGLWSEENVITLNRLLRWLNLVTGLKVNRQKSMLFGIGVDDQEVGRLANIVKCEPGSFPFTYLGIPIGANMKRAKFWKPVIDKFASRLSKWKARHLSFAGRMTLAKSVLGSLPSYYLSLFAAPKGVIKKLEKIRRDFIWGKSINGHKIRWIKWDLLMLARKIGGMGLGNVQSFNYAMLTKWWWRLKAFPNHLWAEVVKAIHGGNFSSSADQIIPVNKSVTGVWKDIGSVERALAKIGIQIKDNLIMDGTQWKWRTDPGGAFSVKQLRLDIDNASAVNDDGRPAFEWNSWATPKANFLLWRATLGRIASKSGLVRRGISLADSLCPRCGLHEEDPNHIFVNCLWAVCVWWNVLAWLRIPFVFCHSLNDLVSRIKHSPGDKVWKKLVYTVAISTVWRLWSARNEKAFNDVFIPVSKTVELIKEEAYLWICNRSKLKSLTWEKWKSFDVVDLL